MSPKAHGTADRPVMKNLKWNVDWEQADGVCCFNRHYAEESGYFVKTSFLNEETGDKEITFYDSVSGLPLFIAPRGRSWKDFVIESKAHGWPSFRDEEVVWANVRVLDDSEAVSTAGTHLGHNIPDDKGNRFCINLSSVAGQPEN